MKEFELKYGCNPNQKPARIYMSNREAIFRSRSFRDVRVISTFLTLSTLGS